MVLSWAVRSRGWGDGSDSMSSRLLVSWVGMLESKSRRFISFAGSDGVLVFMSSSESELSFFV